MKRHLTILTALAASATIGAGAVATGTASVRAAATATVASGSFTGTAKYTGSGTATVQKRGARRTLRLGANFRADSRAISLRMYLATDPSGRTHIDLGRMGETGAQSFAVPTKVNLAKYRYAIAWCASVDEPITTAKLTLGKG